MVHIIMKKSRCAEKVATKIIGERYAEIEYSSDKVATMACSDGNVRLSHLLMSFL